MSMSKFKKNTTIHIDSRPLLNELNKVLKNGIQNLLVDKLKRYEMLEETHNGLINLPSIRNYMKTKLAESDFDVRFDVDDNCDEGHGFLDEINNIEEEYYKIYKKSIISIQSFTK